MKAVSGTKIGGIAVLVAVATFLFLNVIGLCISRMNFVSDTEFIDQALIYRADYIKELAGDIKKVCVSKAR
jgi:hypothetical protein